MSKRKIVVALGGNAILTNDSSAKAQQKALEHTAEYLVQFVENGDAIAVSHGNGPQVGNLLLQQEAAHSEKNPAMPLDTCVAMTQGSIGYWLQSAMAKALKAKGIDKEVASIVTQVVVSEEDPAFKSPSKPVGPFLSKEEAEKQMEETGAKFIEDAGRGWRKVVPSPKPIDIKEVKVIKTLIENDIIPITVGGGGVPVIKQNDDYIGVEAVIDKDFASETLAVSIEADLLVILTGVDNVMINYHTPDEKVLNEVTVDEMKKYVDEKQFAAGSMLPKVEAAIKFVEGNPKGKAIITSLENIEAAISESGGTIITR
ncbi:carbamate kinase [Alkalibacterium putridalgicola]|uniref:Carbamate kinase n=1 Tax=Alkalibacterium putridalgicola TaxID=426703 RepID=A0A1H7SMU9_9LACT|nr:carbamate kinase [Alkalibacterium putridalgicola]GEK89206.1 carbamate kinase [Alkalibacterium putridalgicola]SEL73980.1 carbamate kinase [Alkalibacterium putridalgicola]